MWLPKDDDLRDSSSWSSPPLLLLRDIHCKLLTEYDCKEFCPLSLPQLNRLFKASFVWDENSVSNADVPVIPSQHKVTQQILRHWQPFLDFKLMLTGSRRPDQLRLRSQQRIVATVKDSVLRTEMAGLESQEDDAPNRILFFKPMSWLGQIKSHHRDESWSASLWQTFFVMTMGAQIPVIAEKPLTACGYRKFQLDAMGDHLCTCTAHSGAKKTHDWVVEQLADLFRTTHHTKTQHVTKSRGRHCGDVQLAAYLANAAGPVPLVLDLRIAHDRFGSSSDPSLNDHLHYPNDIDKSLNEVAADKIRKYRADHANNSPSTVSFLPVIASTSGRLHSEFIRLLFLQTHRETDLFLAASGVQLVQTDRGLFHFRRVTFSATLKVKVGSTLAKAAALRITLNIDGASIATSRTHTHPSHSQTSRLLTSSLSLGVPVPRGTQCM